MFFLDGYSLLETRVLCRAVRELPFLVQRIKTISKAFCEAIFTFLGFVKKTFLYMHACCPRGMQPLPSNCSM